MRIYLTLLFSFLLSVTYAQKGMIKGTVIDEKTRKPIAEALVTIKAAKIATSTSTAGKFSISNLKYGEYDVLVTADGYQDFETNVSVDKGVTQLGEWEMLPEAEKSADIAGDINQATTNQDAADESSSTQNVGSALNASRDPFNSAAQFSWGQYFFKQRGYENEHNVTYLNGIPMNDLEDGNASFNTWGGLNDVFRSRTNVVGLAPSDLMYGGLGNTTSLDASASVQRKQTRITYSSTNRSYRNRVMITHSTGVMKNGWAFSGSYSKRWADKGQIQGTFYDANSFFLSAEKRKGIHSIGLVAVGNPTTRGKNGTAMQELFDITGCNNYNPNWGYQNGTIRNARVFKQFVPLFILTDDITFKDNSKLIASASYQFGTTKNSSLDWYNSANPQPDYYGYLPSYAAIDNAGAGDRLAEIIKADPSLMQIQWDNLYAANQLAGQNVAGQSGKRSVYALADDVEKQNRFNIAINYEKSINQHATIYAGGNYMNQTINNYRQMNDLLGGDYWMNVNQFAERTFGAGAASANDLNNSNQIIVVGDKYGYNYKLNFNKAQAWTQGTFTFNKVDFFTAVNVSNTSYNRDGLFKVGLYPTNSFGKSKTFSFTNYGVKLGATYKINGRNYLYANGAIGNAAPMYDNVFISPRTRNEATLAANIKSEKMMSYEAGYLLRTPSVKARVTYFDTYISGAMDIKRFFDPVVNSFANASLTNISKRYNGIEIGADFKISPTISITTATSITAAYYTSRPQISAFVDNDTNSFAGTEYGDKDSIWSIGMRLPNGPQSAFNIGAMYRSPKFWMAGITFNYMGDNYIDFAPSKHIASTVDLLEYTQGSSTYNKFVTQQKLNPFYTIDINFNKSWRATKIVKKAPPRSLFLVNIGISNVLDNKEIQLLGFEQLRLDKTRPSLFDAKYQYAMGRQYFLNLAYSF
jgi:Carboxypeptidase regulatory-like domain